MSKKLYLLLFVFITIAMVMAACQPAATEAPAEPAGEEVEAEEPVEEPTEEPSKVGGTLIYGLDLAPDTLDMQKTANGISDLICSFIGSSLVAKDPVTGEIVPYLADSWEISEDSLSYTFKIKEGVKFHDGTPFTAQEYAFTINRALDPETASPGTAGMIAGVVGAEATDDYTLVLTLAAPNAILLENLALAGYMMPFSQAYVEANDDDFLSRNPMSTGPYIFKEWVTGEKVVVERNPEYTWGPEFGPGPYNIETIEFRIIPEQSTLASGLEAGEIHIYESDAPAIINQLIEIETLDYEQALYFGISAVMLNVSDPVLSDANVRKAINYALNRQAIVDVVMDGYAIPAQGPFSPSVYGYNTELDETGYTYDVEMARSLMEEAGYTLNADGVFEKDGEALALTLNTMATTESAIKMAEVIQQQMKELGIPLEINVMEFGQAIGALMGGQFTLSIMDFGMPNASILNLIFGAQSIGGALYAGVPEVQTMFDQVDGVMTITDPDAWMENVKQAQETIILDDALIAPLYVPETYLFYSKELGDVVYSNIGEAVLNNAYFIQE